MDDIDREIYIESVESITDLNVLRRHMEELQSCIRPHVNERLHITRNRIFELLKETYHLKR